MKLNPDCVRDVLLTVEYETDLNRFFVCSIEQIGTHEFLHGETSAYKTLRDYPLLKKYDNNEVGYHFRQCILSGFFVNPELSSIIKAMDLSPSGHEFLNNVRENRVWKITKKAAAAIGTNSVRFLSQIAAGVITEIIKTNLSGLVSE